MNNIKRCESFLESLKNRSYPDSFEIYYRDYKTCNLEEEVLDIIIEHYENELERYSEELKKLQALKLTFQSLIQSIYSM